MDIKNKLKKTPVYTVYRFVKYLIYPFVLRDANINKDKPKDWSLSSELIDGRKVIVSLTSFPGRIHLVHKVVYSIMNQSIKPNAIVLWLSKDQFPNREQDLPADLMELVDFGLTIEWLDGDIRSYKKLIPALANYPEEIIVTTDDDLYYPRDWLKALVDSYRQYPDEVHCHMVTVLGKNGEKLYEKKRDPAFEGTLSCNYSILGGSGTLYPPHSLHPDVMQKDLFMQIAPTNDDIWFWAMALRKGKRIRWIERSMGKLYYVENSQEDTECLTNVNYDSAHLFENNLYTLVNKYNLWDRLEQDQA